MSLILAQPQGPLVIRADASDRIGAGHVMRCLALAHALKGAGGRVLFLANDLPETFARRIADEGHEIRHLRTMAGGEQDAAETKHIGAEIGAAALVIDLYDVSEAYLDALAGGRATTLCVDDNSSLSRYPVDCVLNLNGHARPEHYVSKGAGRLLLGPSYALLRREFLTHRESPRAFEPEGRKVLVSFGGGNQIPLLVRLIEVLAGPLKNFELSFVLARPEFDPAPLRGILQARGLSHRWIVAPPNMAAELASHDLLISSGGSSVWEALFMGIPAAFVAVAENQRNSCLALRDMVRNPVFPSLDQVNPDALAPFFYNPGFRESLILPGRAVVDGYGAERVIEVVAPESAAGPTKITDRVAAVVANRSVSRR